MIGYHGTSADNLDSILKHGLLCTNPGPKVWQPSLDEVYFWGDNFVESECDPDDDDESIEWRLMNEAMNSAVCTIANAKDCRIVIVKFEVPDDEVDTDNSCPSMEAANCIPRNVTMEEIQTIWLSNDLSLLRGYFIWMMMNRDMSNMEFTANEMRVAECFKNQYWEIEDFVEMEKIHDTSRILVSHEV